MPRRTRVQKQAAAPLVLIAGGAGFFGSHLSESLLNSGASVIGLDDLVTGSLANIASFKRHPHYEFIECNVNQGLPEGLWDRPITHVVQAANVEVHLDDAEVTLAAALTGAFGTKSLLDLAAGTGSRFVLISSMSIYDGLASSTSLNYYFGATAEQEARFSAYEVKRYAEGLCELYAKEYGLDARVARLSDLYGPRMDLSSGSLIARLLKATLEGRDLEVEEEGSQELVLTYIADAVYGVSRLLFAEGDQYARSIYSLANPEKVSVISVAYTLRTLLPPGRDVRFLPKTKETLPSLPIPSIDRVRRDLDWEPTVKVTEGLKMTVEAFRQAEDKRTEPHHVGQSQLAAGTPAARQPVVRREAMDTNGSAGMMKDNGMHKGLKYRGLGVGGGDSPVIAASGGVAEPPVQPVEKPASAPVAETPKADSAPPPVGGVSQPAVQQSSQQAKAGTSAGKRLQPWWRRILFGSLAVLCYVGLGRPLLHTAVYAAAGGWALKQGVSETRALQLQPAQAQYRVASTRLFQAYTAAQPLGWATKMVGQGGTFDQAERMLRGGAAVADGLVALCQAGQPALAQGKALMAFTHPTSQPPSAAAFARALPQMQTSLAQAQQQFGQALTILSGSSSRVAGIERQGNQDVGKGWLGGWLAQATSLLSQAQTALGQAQQGLAVAPQVLGLDGEKSYLLMFENSNELRPTGGFMGSYALVQVADGQIVQFKIDDIYNPDGLLQSTVTAPDPLQQQFQEAKLSLRDANWWPDVPISAEQIASLYEQATGVKIDGVGFVTLGAVRPILKELGPIDLSQYHEQVTAENFDVLAQKHSDIGFTPGSSAKKDFLGTLFEAILGRVEQGNGEWWPIGKAVAQSLQNGDVQLYAGDDQVEQLIQQQGWAGQTKQTKGDYLRVVDANLGGNKANYYVTRQTDYAVDVDRQGHLVGTAKISWHHSGTNGTWPDGDYKTYVRVYVPKGSEVLSQSSFDNGQFTTDEEGDNTVIGGFVTVPYHSDKTLQVRYQLPDSLGLQSTGGAYSLLWQKQAGVESEPVHVQFNAPIFLKLDSASKGAEQQGQAVVWQWQGQSDQQVKLQLASTQ